MGRHEYQKNTEESRAEPYGIPVFKGWLMKRDNQKSSRETEKRKYHGVLDSMIRQIIFNVAVEISNKRA